MKNISKILLLALLSTTIFFGCKKDESIVEYTQGSNPVLKSSVSDASTLPLSIADKDLVALKLSWTNPNYIFSTGISSHSVTYNIEIDTTGSNFSNPLKRPITVSEELSKELTVGDLNRNLVADLKLKADQEHNIEVRVVSTIGNAAAPLASNVFKYKVTPYEILAIPLPASGKLFLVGNATPGGWNNPVPVPSQEFTKVGSTFELTVNIIGGNSYLMLPVNGDWSDKYGGKGSSNNSNNPISDDFKRSGSDLLAPAVSGLYKITVDFKEGRFKFVKQ
jgi:hypothetical protein